MNDSRRLSQPPQRTSTVIAASRVIWLVCEDCGSSKRIVESIGDPDKYFYDTGGEDNATMTEYKKRKPSSSVYRNMNDDGAPGNKRRFALLNPPAQS